MEKKKMIKVNFRPLYFRARVQKVGSIILVIRISPFYEILKDAYKGRENWGGGSILSTPLPEKFPINRISTCDIFQLIEK